MSEITKAAKRAIERLQDTVIDGMIHTPPARAIIEAEFAPLLAAKVAKSLTCCFCNAPCESLAALKEHSAGCKKHSAVKRMEAAVFVAEYEKKITAGVCKARDTLAAQVAELQTWKDALVDATVVAGIYTAEHETNPRKALNDLLCWEHKVALDPAVSEESKKLHGDIEELRKVVQQALNVELQIRPGDTTRGPHDGMISRYEDVLRKTASADAALAVQPAREGGGA